MKYLQITFILFLTLLIIYPVLSQNNAVYTVQLNTIVHDNPPSIHFFWDENLNTENYQIYKRDKNSTEWGQPIATLEGNATQFTDFNIEPGEVFEYGFFKTPSWIMDTALVAPGTHLTFTINDSWGDGICCDIGFGYYQVFVNDSLFISGGDFYFTESTSFSIPANYPPNTMVVVKIYFDNLPDETTWTLTNENTGEELLSGGPYDTHKFTYVLAGIEKPFIEHRGSIMLVVDKAIVPELSNELKRFKFDLIGDGWRVKRIDIDKENSVSDIKAQIINECINDTSIISLLLIGHIPVPYSGEITMDGHPNHMGAWPADAYYGDLDGDWTDNYVNNTSATRPENHNIPGDGKFDQSFLPSDVDLQVGRVDLFDLPAFAESETDLLKRYFDKNHNFRHGLINAERRGLIDENLSQSHHAVGWRNFASLLGAPNITVNEYLPTLENENYLWSFGCGGSGYTSCGGVASTTDFATKEINTVFTMLFGSYFGDWDNQNNVLRSPLASNGLILTNMWACVPHWYIHHMGLGETIGFSTRLSQNNSTEYSAFWGNRVVHTALMGDPTLRIHVVKPISELNIDSTGISEVNLIWQPPEDSILGYNIYRSNDINGGFIRINEQLVAEANYSDQSPLNGKNIYMIRAIKLEVAGSGTYYNMSQGIIDSVSFTNVGIGLNDQKNLHINVYPNPTNGLIYIELSQTTFQDMSLEIINMHGIRVLKKNIQVSEPNHIEKINLRPFSNGIYLIRILNNIGIAHKKIIINK